MDDLGGPEKGQACWLDWLGLDGCCTLAITVTGSPVAVCVGCTTGMETGWVSGMGSMYSHHAEACDASGS